MNQEAPSPGTTQHAEDRRAQSRRLVSDTKLTWLRSRRRWRRAGAVMATVIDLSPDGACILGPADAGVTVGTFVEIAMEGCRGLLEIRWVQPQPDDPRHARYGARFVRNDDALRDVIRERLDAEPAGMELLWYLEA
jgi:hypothetical protein